VKEFEGHPARPAPDSKDAVLFSGANEDERRQGNMEDAVRRLQLPTPAGDADGDAAQPILAPVAIRPPGVARDCEGHSERFSGIRATFRRNFGWGGVRRRTEQATTGTITEKNGVSALINMPLPAKMYWYACASNGGR